MIVHGIPWYTINVLIDSMTNVQGETDFNPKQLTKHLYIIVNIALRIVIYIERINVKE